MIKALSVSSSINLQPLSQHLHAENIRHRISEQGEDQVVWVAEERDIDLVQSSFQRLQAGGLSTANRKSGTYSTQASWSLNRIFRYMLVAPFVSILIVLSAVLTLLNFWSEQQLFLVLRAGSPLYVLESREVWRLVTPIFLHFSVLHLVFNMLMLWVFGLHMEARGERLKLILLVLCSAIASNVAQYFVTGSGFGGMSGVVYAILAYCWLWDRLRPEQAYGFPNALMGLMMVWLLLGYTDILRTVGFGAMANTAHLSGLIAGLLFAWLTSLVQGSPKSKFQH